jgi:hypothetical protein
MTSLDKPDESTRIQKLAKEGISREPAIRRVARSAITRAATLSIVRKRASDQAEQEKANARQQQIEEQAHSEHVNQQDIDDAARRIVAERLARFTITEDEDKEIFAGKAAGESIHRGNERVKDWERVLKSLENKDKQGKGKNTKLFRQSMRQITSPGPNRHVMHDRPTSAPIAEYGASAEEITQEEGAELPWRRKDGAISFLLTIIT